MLEARDLIEYFAGAPLHNRRLGQEIKSLGRKKVRKVDPFTAVYLISGYCYSSGQHDRLGDLYATLIKPKLPELQQLEFQFWDLVGPCILLHAHASGDAADVQRFVEKGFVQGRLEDSLYDLAAKNLERELGGYPTSGYLPKETILQRCRSLVTETVLALLLKRFSVFRSAKPCRNRLEDHKTQLVRLVDHFDLPDDELYRLLA